MQNYSIERRILDCINDPSMPAWFPSLSDALVKQYYSYLDPDLTNRCEYSTAKVLRDDSGHVVSRLKFHGQSQPLNIEVLGERLRTKYMKVGLQMLNPQSRILLDINSTLNQSLYLLSLVPDINSIAADLVRSLHILEAPGEEYDVSHSEPDIPFSIFASIPINPSPIGALRVVESIVHETMHLQLTLIESQVVLISSNECMVYSPWRDELRPLRGVMHGLYVFKVIKDYFHALLSIGNFTIDQMLFIKKRCVSISNEIAQLTNLSSTPGLTVTGRLFIQRLLS